MRTGIRVEGSVVKHWKAWLLLAGVVIGGCCRAQGPRQVTIVQQPEWPRYQEVERIGVMSFVSPASAPDVGRVLAERLAGEISRSQTYPTVVETSQLDRIVRKRDESLAADFQRDQQLRQDMLQVAQVIITGTVSDYRAEVTQAQETRQRLETEYYPDGSVASQRWVPYQVTVYRLAASMSATMRVIDLTTGEVLWSQTSTPEPVTDGPREKLRMSGAEALQALTDRVMADLIGSVALRRRQIKVACEVLDVGSDFADGKTVRVNRFHPEDSQVMVVVQLPAEARLNQFEVAVSRDQPRTNLLNAVFVWGDQRVQQLRFPVGELLSRGGAGKYMAKLYSKGVEAPFAWVEFEISDKPREQ